jgi:hypothetical protein
MQTEFSPTSLETKEFIKSLLEEKIDEVFTAAHDRVGNKTGDVTPGQVLKLDELVFELTNLISEQVEQNRVTAPVVTAENRKVTLWNGNTIENVDFVNIVFDDHANVYFALIYQTGIKEATTVDLKDVHTIN